MIRTFIALPIPDDIKDSLQSAILQLKGKNHGVRWVKPEGLHITLKFLGDIHEDLLGILSVELTEPPRTMRRSDSRFLPAAPFRM
jgi:2'-5' RNA ligase